VIAQLRVVTVEAIQPTGETVELAQVVTPPPPPELIASSLPATASMLPLLGIFGLLAIGMSFALGTFAKRLS